MRFEPCQCPNCGETANRVLCVVETISELAVYPDGDCAFDGQRGTNWETMYPLPSQGKATLYCRNNHLWQAVDLDDPTEEKAVEPAESDLDKVQAALCVIVFDAKTRAYLGKHDPMALRQALNALAEANGLRPISEEGGDPRSPG